MPDSKRLFILLTLSLRLVICVQMDQVEAFIQRPPRRRKLKCSRRVRTCSRRTSKSGTSADEMMKPSDMKDVSTILVGDQFHKFQNLFKSLNALPKSASESDRIKQKRRFRVGRFFALIDSLYTGG